MARKVHMGMGLIRTLKSIVGSPVTTQNLKLPKKVIFKFKIKVAVGHAFS